jgi:hypothetical protein
MRRVDRDATLLVDILKYVREAQGFIGNQTLAQRNNGV